MDLFFMFFQENICVGQYAANDFSQRDVVSEKYETDYSFNSLPARGEFCHLIIFVNSLDPDQTRQNVGPDLDPSCLTL